MIDHTVDGGACTSTLMLKSFTSFTLPLSTAALKGRPYDNYSRPTSGVIDPATARLNAGTSRSIRVL
jgi:hypothetical protein